MMIRLTRFYTTIRSFCKRILLRRNAIAFTSILFFLLADGGTMFAQRIDRADTVLIGGIRQFITLKGRDRSLPLLLFLHGGPGGSVMAYADKFTSKLQEHFVVVQWDQRETGKTLALNASPQPLTFELFGQDTHALVDTLLKRFRQPRLYLAGHSWGTALGFYAAARFPEKLYAWIAISPMIDQLESERILLEKMKEKARHDRDSSRLVTLSTIHIPFQKGDELYQDRRNLFLFNDQRSALQSFSREYALAWAGRWLSVWNEASSVNLNETLPRIDCPVYFFVGSNDLQTNFTIAWEYYDHVQAPKKDFFKFPDVGHNVPTARPARLQQIIVEKILPETFFR